MNRRVAAMAAVLGAALASPADAHLVSTGLGPVCDGIGHVFASPEDWAPVLAMAILAGLGGAETGRRVLFALPLAWLAGGAVGLVASRSLAIPSAATAGSFLVLGTLVALDRRWPAGLVAMLAIALGLLHGELNGASLGGSPRDGALALVGIAAAIFVVVALVAALVVSARRPWQRIAFRVAGSWIAAIGLLLLGWQLRPAR